MRASTASPTRSAPGKQEMKLGITPTAETLGLTLQDLGHQVRQAFYGEEAQRIQRGRDDIRVMVRYPADERRSLGDLENMRIRTPDGAEVPFRQVAVVEPGRGFASIKRVDRNRAVNVSAAVDENQGSGGAVLADLEARVLPSLLAQHPGVSFVFEGVQREQQDAIGGLQVGFAVALFAIFALLAIPLKSYAQPLIIMSAIPFGLVGAVWGHILMGLDETLMSMFGLVAVVGRRRQRQPHHGRIHQPEPAAGAPRGSRHRGLGSWRVPIPADPADVADDVLGTRSGHARGEL